MNLEKVFHSGLVCFVLLTALCAMGQQTVNVSPGDDLMAAVNQAGAGGTVIFAPGIYNLQPNNPTSDKGIVISPELEGITLQGAGIGFDPATASIIDGDAAFLGTAFRVDANDVVVENFTVANFWDEALEVEDASNVEFRNVWAIACKLGIQTEGAAGLFTEDGDFSQWVRAVNCVFAKGADVIEARDNSLLALINCDIRDAASDLLEPDESAHIYLRNCIIDKGLGSNDLDTDGASLITIDHCVFYGPKVDVAADITAEFDLGGGALLDDVSVLADPMYVNGAFNSAIDEYDFHLKPGSPALTAGLDLDGNVTYAGSAGPAQ